MNLENGADSGPTQPQSKGLRGIRGIEELPLRDRRVFLRLDLNVPMRDGKITDDTRLVEALPTIRYAMKQGAKLVLASHFGRPEGKEGDREKYTLEPVAQRLNESLGVEVILIEEPRSEAPKALLPGLRSNQLILLENLRFDKEETENGRGLAQAIAAYTDVYINDAFGASHRAHASIVGVPALVSEKGVGFLMKKEVEVLDRLMVGYESPFLAILGGAKVSDKVGVIEHLVERVDAFMIGGAMAYTFLAAKGIQVGSSRVEKDKLRFVENLIARLEARQRRIYLPEDHLIAPALTEPNQAQHTSTAVIPEGWMGVDIGPKTIAQFTSVIQGAKTVFWNGPMGVFETPRFSEGTLAVARALAESQAWTVVGGGDSAAAAKVSGYAHRMGHISTGGGASLEYLQGDLLPGLEAVRSQKKTSETEPGNPFL